MLAQRNTLKPGLVICGHLVVTDPGIDEIRTVDGEIWTREPRSGKWVCGPHWRADEWAVSQIDRGAWVRRKPD